MLFCDMDGEEGGGIGKKKKNEHMSGKYSCLTAGKNSFSISFLAGDIFDIY